MEDAERSEFTLLLREWSNGSKAALDRLTPLIYDELRKLAASRLRQERSAHTLQPTALVHEAYVRLISHDQTQWHGRAHFYSVASHLMRQILVDHARKHRAAKRGSGAEKVELNDAVSFAPERASALIALDDALRELASFDPFKSQLIEMRYFGGLEGEEIAEILGVSRSTVTRNRRLAEAWLHNYLTSES